MSLPKPSAINRRQVLRTAGLMAMLPVAGCFRPLYGTRVLPGDETMLESLSTIAVDSTGGRQARFFRNELLFLLRGGKAGLNPVYRLEHQLTPRVSSISLQIASDVPRSFILNLTVSYALWDIDKNRVVLHGTSFSEASFSYANQRFANSRAYIDAQQRAAKVIADEVRLRIAAFMSGKST